MIKDLVYEALNADPKCRTDDAYLISYVWAEGDKDKLLKIYQYLLKRESPKTIYRRKLEWEVENPALAMRGESTEALKKSLEGQDMLPMGAIDSPSISSDDLVEIGKQYLKKIRGQVSKISLDTQKET